MAGRSSSIDVEQRRGGLRRAARRGGGREGEGDMLTTTQDNNSITTTRKSEKKMNMTKRLWKTLRRIEKNERKTRVDISVAYL